MAVYDALTFVFALLSFLLGLIVSFFAWPEITVFLIVAGYYFSFFVVAQTIGEDGGWHDSALRVNGRLKGATQVRLNGAT